MSIQQYTVSGHLQYSDLDKLTCFRYDIIENRWVGVKQQPFTYS